MCIRDSILTSASDSVVKQEFRLEEGTVTIGRHPGCDLHINDGSVSRKHAMVNFRDDAYYVEDLDSRNGTFLNDSKLAGPAKLYDGAQVKICDVVFTFLTSDAPKTTESRPPASGLMAGTFRQSILESIVFQDLSLIHI